MMSSPPSRSLIDAAALLVVGVLLNAVFSSGDPGWIDASPSPFLLVPAFLGARYGFREGLLGGLVTGGLILVARLAMLKLSFAESISSAPFTYLAFPLFGAIIGELRRLQLKRETEALQKAAELERSVATLESDLEAVSESRHQFRQRLALFGAESCAYDLQLRALFAPVSGPVLPRFLELLQETTGVEEAGIYFGSGDSLSCSASIGGAPNKVKRSEPILAKSLQVGGLVTLPECGGKRPKLMKGTWIAAIPLPHPDGVGVLLVRRMEFFSMTWPTFQRIEIACRWLCRFSSKWNQQGDLLAASDSAQADFPAAVKLARDTADQLDLPSTKVVFTVPTEKDPEAFLDQLRPALRPTDVPHADRDRGEVSVLLPMEGLRDAELFAREGAARFAEASAPEYRLELVQANSEAVE